MIFAAIVILQAMQTAPPVQIISFVQFVSYALMIFNVLYSIVIAVFIIPTYQKYKLIDADYTNRVSPAAVELQKQEKEKAAKYEKDLADIKHEFASLKQQISTCLNRMEREPDMEKLIDILNRVDKKV